MKPVTATLEVEHPRDEVFDFLDVMANHELFTDHFMQQWRCAGPPTGVGARASVVNVLGGRRDPVEIVVIDADPPHRTTEQNVSAGGKRVAEGAYELEELPGGGTRVTFIYRWVKAPLSDRLLAPLARRLLRRAAQTALERLRTELVHADVRDSQRLSAPAGS